MTINDYQKAVIRVLKKANVYSAGLGFQIQALAGALHSLEKANAEIEGLTTTTVLEQTRYGSKLAPHPAFKVQRDAMDNITRQLKALGLTAEALGGAVEDDPLIELTKKVAQAGKKASRAKSKPGDAIAD